MADPHIARRDTGGAGQAGWATDDHTHASKGLIAAVCLSLPVWLLIAWAVGVI